MAGETPREVADRMQGLSLRDHRPWVEAKREAILETLRSNRYRPERVFQHEAWLKVTVSFPSRYGEQDPHDTGPLLALKQRLLGDGWNDVNVRTDPSPYVELLLLDPPLTIVTRHGMRFTPRVPMGEAGEDWGLERERLAGNIRLSGAWYYREWVIEYIPPTAIDAVIFGEWARTGG